jgi:RNA polymerase sigma-70 factor, ECF subfamily
MLNMDLVTNQNEVGLERFEAVALLHMQELYRTAVAMLRDRNQAEDIVQETYLRAWKAFSSFTPGTNCRAWLFKILFREISHHRRNWFNRFQFCGPEALDGLIYKAPQSEDLTDEEILSALKKLPARFAEVVLLADVHEFTYREIEETLNIPIGTVMSRLSRGRSLLRSYLAGAHGEGARPTFSLSHSVRRIHVEDSRPMLNAVDGAIPSLLEPLS